MMSRIDSQHWTMSTGHHFQNGHHNTSQIQHCPISATFHVWVDYDVPNGFPALKNFYRSPFSKWPLQYLTNSTLFDFNEISYVDRLWCPELNPDIAKCLTVSIFKMATTIPQQSSSEFVTMQSVHLNLLSVAGLGDIVSFFSYVLNIYESVI
jgi:hypothetical protein